MRIKSNTKNKVKKMLEGKIFDNPMIFITELLQNSYRAKAKNIRISINEDVIEFEDDGVGLKNPENLLTLDTSEWDSTSEGFGIGFWSVLGVPNIESVEILSKNHRIYLDVEKLNEDLDVLVEKTEDYFDGFKVILKSNYFMTWEYSIIEEIQKEGRFIPIDIFINDEPLKQEDLFHKVSGEYTKVFNNRLFTAKLSVSEKSGAFPEIYYEYRLVKKCYHFQYVSGVIHLKPGAVQLKEPDRKSIIYNDDFYSFRKKVLECIHTLYKDFIKDISEDIEKVDKYSDVIKNYLTTKDFENFLYIDKDVIKVDLSSMGNNENKEELVEDKDNFNENDEMPIEEEPINSSKSIDLSNFEVNDNKDIHIIQNKTGGIIKEEKNASKMKLKDFIKKNQLSLWVNSNEIDKYSDFIGLAKYYGIEVLVSKNSLFENFFISKSIPHIRELEDCMTSEYKITNNNPKTKKEESFLMMLEPIRKEYNLPANTFKIGDIYNKVTININKKQKVNILKNKINEINIYGVTNGCSIVFDRRAMNLKKFNISLDKDNPIIGKNEMKCLLYNISTIAHELAHLLYKTTDNTDYHFKMEQKLISEIGQIYMNY